MSQIRTGTDTSIIVSPLGGGSRSYPVVVGRRLCADESGTSQSGVLPCCDSSPRTDSADLKETARPFWQTFAMADLSSSRFALNGDLKPTKAHSVVGVTLLIAAKGSFDHI